jgi:pentatricopeptide repeat protein
MRMLVYIPISFVPLLELVSHDLHRLTVHMIRRDMLRAHNALLHVYASHGQVEKAKQLYSSMQERGPAIDAVSGSTIIAAYAKVTLALHSIHHVQSSLHNWFASIALVDWQEGTTWLVSIAGSTLLPGAQPD